MGGSSKKRTVGYKYHLGMHMILCHGPVDKLIRATLGEDKRIAWEGENTGGQIRIDSPELFGGEKREGGVEGDVDVEMGTSIQGKNDYLQSQLGSDIPAFRKVVGLVFRQVYLGMNPYLKKWAFRLQRIHKTENGQVQWYDSKSEIIPLALTDRPAVIKVADIPSLTSVNWSFSGFEVNEVSGEFSSLKVSTVEDGFDPLDTQLDGTTRTYDATGNEILAQSFTSQKKTPQDELVFNDDVGVLFGKMTSEYFRQRVPGNGGDNVSCFSSRTSILGSPVNAFGISQRTYHSLDFDMMFDYKTNMVFGYGHAFGVGNWIGAWDLFTGNPIASIPQDDNEVKFHYDQLDEKLWIFRDNLFKGYELREVNGVQQFVEIDSFTPVSVSESFETFIAYGDVFVMNPKLISGQNTCYVYRRNDNFTNPIQTIIVQANSLIQANDGYFSVGQEVFKIINLPNTGRDMNPAHIIRECLTDSEWGMGYDSSNIDNASFTSSADTLYDEGMGISILWDRQNSIENFITEIIKHIDAALYVSRDTGQFVLKLIRDDYVEGSLLLFDESNIEKISDLNRSSFGELTNSVTVNYWDNPTGETASVTVQDAALIQMQNGVINTTIQYPGFTNSTLAGKVAMRDLSVLSARLWSGTIYTDQTAKDLNIGDVFKLSFSRYEISEIVMRITGIAYGDGRDNRVRITATQDKFFTPAKGSITGLELNDGWTAPETTPTFASIRKVIESPYYELAIDQGQTTIDNELANVPEAGYIIASAVRPNVQTIINAALFVDPDGNGYVDSDVLNFCPYAQLNGAVGKMDTVFNIDNLVDSDLIEVGQHAQIDNEIVRIDVITSTTIEVGRGVLDTVPENHVDNSHIVFWDLFPASDEVQYVDSESVNVKILPTAGSNTLPESQAPADNIVFQSRAIRPYPPGNFRVNANYFPEAILSSVDLALTWAHRDRRQQTSTTLNEFTDGNIGPEVNTTYTARIYGETDSLIKTETGINGTSYTYLLSDEITDSNIQMGGQALDFDYFILDYGSLGYWRLDESSGTTATDSSGNGRNGTIVGSPILDAGSMLNTGAGSSIDFDGIDDYISVQGTPFSNHSAITVVAIVNLDSLTNRMRIITKGTNVGGDRTLYSWDLSIAQTSGNCTFNMSNGASFDEITHSSSLSISTNYLIIGAYDGSNVYISINGTLESLARATTGENSEGGNVYIGMENDGGWTADLLDGKCAEVAVFNRLLSPSEMTKLYDAYSAGPLSTTLRQNGRLRIELESTRDGYTSLYHQEHIVKRPGYGLNYGEYYGNSV